MNVFISYSSEDRPRAATLASALEACGWSVWWDRKILAGQHFDLVIERQLDEADAVVVLWSKQSVKSEWVKNEAAAAADRGVLIPALIDDCRLPLEFRRRQAADLTGWKGDMADAGFKGLCLGVAQLCGTPPSAAPDDRGLSRAASLSKKGRWIGGGIATVAVVLGVGGYAGLRLLAPEKSMQSPAESPPVTVDPKSTVQEPAPASDLTPNQAAENPGTAFPDGVGAFEFNWPGGDCWEIYRGDRKAESNCGRHKQALQAGTYVVKPLNFAAFAPFSIDVKPGLVTSTDAMAGWLEFNWPGGDCWEIYRGDQKAEGNCGRHKQALQAGTYVVKPLNFAAFAPFSIDVKPGLVTSTDAMAGWIEFNWPGGDCWAIYRGDQKAESNCGRHKQALQAGTYVVKPVSSEVFKPFEVQVTRGQTTSAP